jgi:hypothetical protein
LKRVFEKKIYLNVYPRPWSGREEVLPACLWSLYGGLSLPEGVLVQPEARHQLGDDAVQEDHACVLEHGAHRDVALSRAQ